MLSSHFILCREGICRSRGVAHGGRLVCPDGLSLITARRSCMASLHYTVWVISVWRNDYPQLCSRDGEPTHAAPPPPRLALMLVVLPHCHWTVGPVSPAWSLADGPPVVFPLKTGRSPISPQEAPPTVRPQRGADSRRVAPADALLLLGSLPRSLLGLGTSFPSIVIRRLLLRCIRAKGRGIPYYVAPAFTSRPPSPSPFSSRVTRVTGLWCCGRRLRVVGRCSLLGYFLLGSRSTPSLPKSSPFAYICIAPSRK
jgi:hypothetical protein